MLTIGQLASYAGVTVRAVRHYHAKGLLPEPERDHSGYRRYDAHAVVELIKIRTLADAGVPLARVRELLVADEEEFNAAVADIDRRLRAEIRERQRHRERIAQLAAGDSLALPPEAVAYLDRLRELGLPELMIGGERDAWILVAAQLPEQMPFYMTMKQQQLDDPATVALYRDLASAIGWEADDPRVTAVADRLARPPRRRRRRGVGGPRRADDRRARGAPRLGLPRLGPHRPPAPAPARGARLARLDQARADRPGLAGRAPPPSPRHSEATPRAPTRQG